MTVLCQIAQKIVRPAFKQEETIGLRPNCLSDPANLFFVKIVCVSNRRYQPLNVTYLKQKRKCPFQEIKLQIIDNLALYRVVRGIPNKDQEDPIGTPYTVSLVCIKTHFQLRNDQYRKYM